MTRKLLLQTISGLHEEVFTNFSKNLSAKLHADRFHARLKKLFDYTLSDGKCARSELALNTFQVLAPNASESQVLNAAKVAASIEVLQSFFLIIDDVVDHSEIRRGKLCWHKLPEIGLKACIDGLVLESSVDIIVRNAIRNHPKRYAILNNISETKAKTATGQELDTATTEISDFSWELYNDIVKHKTSHYTYYFPLSLGFQLADTSTDLAMLKSIAYKLGYLFQAQDDYLDAFGNVFVTGKSSNDFSDSKCTWIICTLLDRIAGDKDKMTYLIENFGKSESNHLTAIHKLLTEEKVDVIFKNFQENAINEIKKDISEFPLIKVRDLLDTAVRNIANRKK